VFRNVLTVLTVLLLGIVVGKIINTLHKQSNTVNNTTNSTNGINMTTIKPVASFQTGLATVLSDRSETTGVFIEHNNTHYITLPFYSLFFPMTIKPLTGDPIRIESEQNQHWFVSLFISNYFTNFVVFKIL
jgi:hypothetical protein